ncbi:MAG TPA: GTPase domain-containing protein, partial [Gemmataceae bacterium]|nr:GTPase domain-containing protein [Gemmataceae bacterium]
AWLEEHCRAQSAQGLQAGQLRLASALVRDCIGPYLDDQPASPLHVVVVGGAGAGKSTVANLLSGASAAEANPQAGFTKHPIAYTASNGTLNWAGHLGFLGPLQRQPEPGPANLDADVYQVRQVTSEAGGLDLLKDLVIWDCPDMTTWAASGYVPRLLEVAGLADIIVYVASDERYNDEVPTQFLRLLLQTGKPVIVCLMKMKEADVPAIVGHFQHDVLGRMPGPVVSCLAIPFLSVEELADPARLAPRFRIPLLNQVAVIGRPAKVARERTIRGAAQFLASHTESLLSSAQSDIAALHGWRNTVQTGKGEFDSRYQREYLHSEKFQQFDQALVRLLDLLELPGVGKVVSSALWVLRTPYRLLKGLATKALTRPEGAALPETAILEQALEGWLDLLRKEAVRQAGSHPLWAHIEQGFLNGLGDKAHERFQQGFRGFQLGLAEEVNRTARAIYEELEKSPARLNTLRGIKFTFDAGAIGLAIAAGGTTLWHDLILVPVAAAITQQLVEFFGQGYVESQRELARQRQQALMVQYISGPLAEWLIQWPATGGSSYERLQLALKRLPPAVRQLHAAVFEQLAHADSGANK